MSLYQLERQRKELRSKLHLKLWTVLEKVAQEHNVTPEVILERAKEFLAKAKT